MSKILAIVGVVVIAVGVIFVAYIQFSPTGRAAWNSYQERLQKVDDDTLYQTRKKVEDTCRSMKASYTSDSLTWEQYKDSDNTEEVSWANQAKMRANKTASSYNEFVLKNSYVWDNNVPDDVDFELNYID